MMELRHYRREPLTFDPGRACEQSTNLTTFGKPVGFWVSVLGEDDWPSWCRSNEFRVDTLEQVYKVTLVDDANICILNDAVELDRFTVEYAVETEFDRRFAWRRDPMKWSIDWPKVAQQYAGIIIPNYLWPCRNEYDWYYGWDCASGCIWDMSAIASVEPAAVSA